jgi:ribonuclease HI
MSNITINTDASFCPITGASGWAFYIICDEFRIKKSGNFTIKPTSAEEAEMMCIGNAFAYLSNKAPPKNIKLIVVNTDCMSAVDRIYNCGKSLSKKVRILKNNFITKFSKPKFEFRHVKAHSGKKDARSYVNEWCDENAKIHMRKERTNINLLNKKRHERQ